MRVRARVASCPYIHPFSSSSSSRKCVSPQRGKEKRERETAYSSSSSSSSFLFPPSVASVKKRKENSVKVWPPEEESKDAGFPTFFERKKIKKHFPFARCSAGKGVCLVCLQKNKGSLSAFLKKGNSGQKIKKKKLPLFPLFLSAKKGKPVRVRKSRVGKRKKRSQKRKKNRLGLVNIRSAASTPPCSRFTEVFFLSFPTFFAVFCRFLSG